MKVRTLMLLKFHYDPTAEGRDRCFHRKFSAKYLAASHLGALDEVMEAFPRFGVGTNQDS